MWPAARACNCSRPRLWEEPRALPDARSASRLVRYGEGRALHTRPASLKWRPHEWRRRRRPSPTTVHLFQRKRANGRDAVVQPRLTFKLLQATITTMAKRSSSGKVMLQCGIATLLSNLLLRISLLVARFSLLAAQFVKAAPRAHLRRLRQVASNSLRLCRVRAKGKLKRASWALASHSCCCRRVCPNER